MNNSNSRKLPQQHYLNTCLTFVELEDLTTPAPPRLHYTVEVKLINLGDGFMAPTPGSPDFEIISNRISDSFTPLLDKLPGYYQIRLSELQKSVSLQYVLFYFRIYYIILNILLHLGMMSKTVLLPAWI